MQSNHRLYTQPKSDQGLDSIESAIEDIKNGKLVIVVDDEDRENEGDFVCAAEVISPEIINFMAKEGRGLICAPIEESRAAELGLNMMVNDNTSLHETAFTVSIDYLREGCTTGISAYDRATGIKALTNKETKPSDYARPGHIFPLKAKDGGVLRRTGHTEAAVDLARIAGLYPAGVLVEILNEDGTMARLPQLRTIADKFDLKIISIADLVEYRMRNERIISRIFETSIAAKKGNFKVIAFRQETTSDVHLAVVKGSWNEEDEVMVRVHSSTETGDILGLLFNAYGETVSKSLDLINQEGSGVLLFMRHGEKGDLLNCLQKIGEEGDLRQLQRRGDQRDFGIGAQILRDLGVRKIKLITRSQRKRIGLLGYGLEIVENISLDID
jgi:3,4-dihydroxy 2-butanone 4-phosphate synthase/GTP cyclohydrolase II